MKDGGKRHCWDCRRRRLVCDSAHPACRRCIKAGRVCLGYGPEQPLELKWLAPGRVTSRRRKPRKVVTGAAEDSENGGRTGTEQGLFNRLVSMAIPPFEMTTEAHALDQAIEYFNTCIFQEMVPILELGPNPHIYTIPPIHLQYGITVPDYLPFSFVCMTLSHRMNRARLSNQPNALAKSYYRCRQIVLHSIQEDIDVQQKQKSDFVIAGIMTLLLADLQQDNSPSWRCHLEGVQKLIALRGGIRSLAGSNLEPALVSFVSVAVFANTTCPASDLSMAELHLEHIDFFMAQYSDHISPFSLCPLPIFAEIIKINHLRAKAGTRSSSHLLRQAYEVLSSIESFLPGAWAATKPSTSHDWSVLGLLYQAAATLYCISSLQSLSILPTNSFLNNSRCDHSALLQVLLDQALSSPRVKRFVLWPLVVLGVEAANGEPAMRAFVKDRLLEMSCYAGTYAPLAAMRVVETFWDSGEAHWDACFDRPYAFSTQIAVDVSRVLLSS